MTKYCAIEGSSYAGKTTIVQRLSENGYPTIGEYDQFVDLNGRIAEDKIAMADVLIDAERIRTSNAATVINGTVFSDRSVISLLTFCDMSLMCKIGEYDDNIRVREHILNRLDREVLIGNIVLMNALVVVRLNQDEFNSRVKKRGITPVWQLSDFGVSQHITSQAVEYGRQLIGEESVIELDVSGLDEADTAEIVFNVAQKLPQSQSLKKAFHEL